MTHAPIPPWAERVKSIIEDAAGIPVGLCWIPRKGQISFTINGVTTVLSVLFEGMRRERKGRQGGGRR